VRRKKKRGKAEKTIKFEQGVKALRQQRNLKLIEKLANLDLLSLELGGHRHSQKPTGSI